MAEKSNKNFFYCNLKALENKINLISNLVLQALKNAQNQLVTIPFGSQGKNYDCLCMTALPDDLSFALIGGSQTNYNM